MLTPTQSQLSNQLYHSLKEHFPDIELGELAADMTTDILIEQDCDIIIGFATSSASPH